MRSYLPPELLNKELKTAGKQLDLATNKVHELKAKMEKGNDMKKVEYLSKAVGMKTEDITNAKIAIRDLKKLSWQNEKKIKSQKNEEDVNNEVFPAYLTTR